MTSECENASERVSLDAFFATVRARQRRGARVESFYDPGMNTEHASIDSAERKRPSRTRIVELWLEHVGHSQIFPQFVMVTSFLVTFGIVRFITYGIRDGWLPVGNASSGGTHLHHYLWGIALVFIAGYIQIAFAPKHGRAICAALFGAGEALILDEFALLLNLKDVYWTGKGRESIIAVAVAGSFLLLIFFSRTFYRSVYREWRGKK